MIAAKATSVDLEQQTGVEPSLSDEEIKKYSEEVMEEVMIHREIKSK